MGQIHFTLLCMLGLMSAQLLGTLYHAGQLADIKVSLRHIDANTTK